MYDGLTQASASSCSEALVKFIFFLTFLSHFCVSLVIVYRAKIVLSQEDTI